MILFTSIFYFNRNLDVSEIIGQLCFANSRLPRRKTGLPAISNVVFMGMGEPLANYKNVIKAIEIMLSDYAYGLSDDNKCYIHSSFSSNDNWPYDWDEYCSDE